MSSDLVSYSFYHEDLIDVKLRPSLKSKESIQWYDYELKSIINKLIDKIEQSDKFRVFIEKLITFGFDWAKDVLS